MATTQPQVVLCVVKEEPDFPVRVGEIDFLQRDDVWMLQLSQQL